MKSPVEGGGGQGQRGPLQGQLHRAVDAGDIEAVEHLLAQGADVNAPDEKGRTALRVAWVNHNQELAILLQRSGGTLEKVRSVLDDALSGKLSRVVPKLGKKPKLIRGQDRDGWSLLHWAARGRSFDIAEFLAFTGADIDVRNRQLETPVHMVALADSREIMELFIFCGAELDATTIRGYTPLHYAACNGAEHVAEILVEKGLDADVVAELGRTPLHCAAAYGRAGVAGLLLYAGADVNAREHDGQTPLHHAASWGRRDVAQILIKHGADLKAHNDEGRDPLDEAREYHHADVIHLLEQYRGLTG